MKNKQITILHVISSLKQGGTERYLMNLLQNGSKRYRHVVMYYYGKNNWADFLDKHDVKVYKAGEGEQGKNRKRMKQIKEIISREKVDVIYAYTYYNSAFVMTQGFLSGVKVRITHAHRSKYEEKVNPLKVIISRFLVSIFSTDCLACNDESGRSLFCKFRKFKVINNGIDLTHYEYDPVMRNELRCKLKIDNDCTLLGIIGRLDENKNQRFAIDCFDSLRSDIKNSKLLIIGDGPLKKELLAYVKKLGIEDKVVFTGNVDDTCMYYSAIDLLLVTSIHEGLPFVLVEAQANGLPILASSSISKDAKINDNYYSIDLTKGAAKWAKMIMHLGLKRCVPNKKIKKYSIVKTVKIVEEIYEKAR